MPPQHVDAHGADLELVQQAVRSGVTSKRASSHDNHWHRWIDHCLGHNLDPFLRQCEDPVPLLQVFMQRYRDGSIAPSGVTVKSRTAEDALQAVGQKFASMGISDPRKDAHGMIDFRITRQLKFYKKSDAPPIRIKPVPITLVLYILQVAHVINPTIAARAIADMITITFYFLLRPGEYTGTRSDDHPFLIQDIKLHLGSRPLDTFTAPIHEIEAATSVSLTFTRQKNGVCNEVLSHGRSSHHLCCPVRAAIRRLLYHRQQQTRPDQPLALYKHNNKLIPIAAKDVTERIKHAAVANFHVTGIKHTELSARSLRAGGAMALLCGNIDCDLIQMLGRWHSDAMVRYLHLQAQPIMKQLASRMFNNGQYTFLPDETVPILNLPQ